MTPEITLRPTNKSQTEEIVSLYPLAFPEEDLRDLVRELLAEDYGIYSFAAIHSGSIIGHIVFAEFHTEEPGTKFALLGPLAILPDYQRQGVGTALIQHGLSEITAQNISQCFVLGSPDYYGRSGFAAETSVLPPYDLPPIWEGAWQSIALNKEKPVKPGRAIMPAMWMKPELWLP